MGVFDFAKEGLLTRDQAAEVVSPFTNKLSKCWHYAWDSLGRQDEDFRARVGQCPTARAHLLNALAISYARELFAGEPGVEVCEDLQFLKLYVTGKAAQAILRFNAVGADFVVHNINASDQKSDYFNNHDVRGLRNGLTRLTVGCATDASKSQIGQVVISLQLGETLLYHFRIDDEQIEQLPAPAPLAPVSPKTQIRLKGGKQAKEG